MISSECFSADWIKKKRKELVAQDPGILEKCIHALALLSHLSESGLDFIFKGGTSLLLHLQQVRRLSIDIDIICSASIEMLDSVLQSICIISPFVGYEENERGNRGLPNRRHFKFFFNSNVGKKERLYVLLDVIEEPVCHLPLTTKPIYTPFIEIEKETSVKIPTIEGLLGDKLTAFAPNTIGVPFENRNGESQAMQVAKQLFDVGELFSNAADMSAFIGAYHANYTKENEYRGNNHELESVLNDTIETSYNYCGLSLKKFPEHKDAVKLRDGNRGLSNHLVGKTPDLNEQMKVAAAKAALLSTAIRKNRTDFPLAANRYDEDKIEKIRTTDLAGDFAKLIRLKKANPEAYYYLLIAENL